MKFINVKRVLVGVFMGLLMFSAPQPSHAATRDELIAQIQTLQALIAALDAGSNTSTITGCPYTWTRDLSMGSTGQDVLKLQQFLNSDPTNQVAVTGVGSKGQETQTYGPLTAAAVSKFQVKYRSTVLTPLGLQNGTGYFGASSRAKANAICVATPAPDTGSNTGGLSGNAGSVDSYKLISSYNNEEVGENQNDVAVAGLEIKANRGSDLRLRSVQLVFDEGTADQRFEKYAEEVALYLDDEEVARVDADEFTKNNNWTRNISLDNSAIIRAGKTGELTVRISAERNIDSADEGETWTVDFRSIRYTDAQGSTITEDPNTAARTFSFESFANAANAELRISDGDDAINDSRIIQVHATRDTDNQSLLAFNMEVRGDSDITIDSLPVTVSVTGASNVDDVINSISLYMDGERVDTVNIGNNLGNSSLIVFDNMDLTLDAGEEYEFEVRADFNSLANALDAGDTITVTFGETETDSSRFEAEDEGGDELSDASITGSAVGGPHALYEDGITATFVSATETVRDTSGADNDSATFKITFDVEAFGGTVYVANKVTATSTNTVTDSTIANNGMLVYIDKADSGVTTGITGIVTAKTEKGTVRTNSNGIEITEGSIARITVSVTRENQGNSSDNGFYQAAIAAIGWNTNGSSTYNVYNFNLKDFTTEPVYLD